jgi:hypothetical protein
MERNGNLLKTFSAYLNEVAGKMGQGTVADQAGIDPSLFSKFKNGQGCLSLDAIEKLLKINDAGIVSNSDARKLEDALAIVADLWKNEREKARKEVK